MRATFPKSNPTVQSPAGPEFAKRDIHGAERNLARYLCEVGEVGLIDVQEEKRLAVLIKKGNKAAREKMITANLRLVVKIAKEYEGYGLPFLDLISEGNIGLMNAVEHFDPNKGAKLSTYASWWIKQSIKRALANQGKTIRLPIHVVDRKFHMNKVAASLARVFGREPTAEELAEELCISVERVRDYQAMGIRPVSLNAPITDSGDNSDDTYFSDVIPDEGPTASEVCEKRANIELLEKALKEMPQRERMILSCRFGLTGEDEMTLENCGEKFGVTRERIRQIQNLAFKRLKEMLQRAEKHGTMKNAIDRFVCPRVIRRTGQSLVRSKTQMDRRHQIHFVTKRKRQSF